MTTKLMEQKEKIEVFPLYSDLMFKYIFGYQKNVRFTSDFLESFYGIRKGSLKDIKVRNSVKLDRETIIEKKYEDDIQIVLRNGEIINLEIYTKFDDNAIIKSVMYITSIFSSELKVSEDYNLAKKVTQLNFVKGNNKEREEVIRKYLLINQNDKTDNLIPELFQIYIINVDSKSEVRYNKVNKDFYQWLRLINANTKEEMEEAVKGKKIMEEALEEMKKFSGKEYVQNHHARDVLIKSQHNSEMKELEQSHRAREILIESQHNSEMKELEQSHRAREILIESQHNSEMKELEQSHRAREILIESQHNSEIRELEQNYQAKEELIKSQHNSEIKELEQNHKVELEESEKEKALDVAKNLLKTSLSLEEIAMATGLSLKEVKKLKNNN